MDEDAKKIRSSLMAISLYLILYWLADGNIGPAGEVKIGTISFGNPLWIKAAGLSIFFYLLWRYHIYGKIAFDEFKADIYLKLVANSEYIDYVVGCETLRQSLWDESLGQLDKQRTRWPVVSYSKDPADPQDVTMPPLPRGYFYPDIIYSSMKATRGAMDG